MQIKEKEENVLQQMNTIANNLVYAYPDYENYLIKKKENNEGRLWNLEEPFRVDVKKPHGNYWKFKCLCNFTRLTCYK